MSVTTRSDLIERILGLNPDQDLEQLRCLSRELVEHRENPQMEKRRFEGTKLRGITGYDQQSLRPWRRVLVTGGTGCVGHVVLSNLVHDLPDAALFSVARNHPVPERTLDDVTYIRGDVRNPEKMTAVMRDVRPDLVVHLAAQRSPALAEKLEAETVSTNIVGSQVVLEAAGESGVDTVVVASTGKAVRLFTSDVYAGTKKLVEYQSAMIARRYDMKVSCTRFTHVVDNSIVGQNIKSWIATSQPIQVHSPLVQLPVQSARECYQLLMTAGIVADAHHPKTVALRDLGWPPIGLLDLTLDYLADSPESRAPIFFTGYPPGYEAEAYPGTYDPMSAGDVSPLVNCMEAVRTLPTPVYGDLVDHFEMTDRPSEQVDSSLAAIAGACNTKRMSNRKIRSLLAEASVALFDHTMGQADPERVERIHRLGRRHDPLVEDHAFIHQRLQAFSNTGAAVSAGPPPLV